MISDFQLKVAKTQESVVFQVINRLKISGENQYFTVLYRYLAITTMNTGIFLVNLEP